MEYHSKDSNKNNRNKKNSSKTMTKKTARRRLVEKLFARSGSSKDSTTYDCSWRGMNNRAVSYCQRGNYQEAFPLLEEACYQSCSALMLPARADWISKNLNNSSKSDDAPSSQQQQDQPVGGEEEEEVPKSSYMYQRLDFDEGFKYYQETVPVQDEDENDPSTVASIILFNVAQLKRLYTHDYPGALELYKRAHAIQHNTKNNPRNHHRIHQYILHNMGQMHYRHGNINDAISCFQAALTHLKAMHGNKRYRTCMETGVVLNCLGVLYYHQSSSLDSAASERALSCFREAYEIVTLLLQTEQHKEVATILNNIGRLHVQREDFDQALVYYNQALQIRAHVLGRDSVDYAATAFNVGQSVHKKGNLNRAMQLYQEFLRAAQKRFPGWAHRDIAVVLSGMAQIYHERHEYDKALELYEESLKVGRAALGDCHSEIASLLNRIGNFHFERDDMEAALECYREGLSIDMAVLSDKSHPNIIITISNIGEIYRQRQEYPAAIRMYKEALELQKQRYGQDTNHVDIASTLNALGLIYEQKGEYQAAQQHLHEALATRMNLLGADHLDVASTFMHLGTIHYRKSQYSQAQKCFSDAHRIRHEQLGQDNRDVSFSLYNVGLCFLGQSYYREAIDCFNETLRVEKLVLGENHRDVAMTMYKLGHAHHAEGDLDRALFHFKESLRIERQVDVLGQPPDAATLARTLNQIGNIHMARGDVILMMDSFNEAARILQRAGLNPNSINVKEQLYAIDVSCHMAAAAA